MTYSELKTYVLDFAHRPDLTTKVASFIALAEGMIRREVRALPLTITLDEDDRDTGGVYNLPATLDEIRAVHVTGANGSYPLEQVALAAIRRLPTTADPYQFCVNGDTMEIRGVPDTDAEIELHYLGHPAALALDADTNDLLTNHETLYVSGALFHLYKYTQDLELAQGELDTFADAVEKLNEQIGRKLGGASIAPAYHFGPVWQGY